MGAEAIHDLLAKINLDELSYELRSQADGETSQQRKKEALKRLQIVESCVRVKFTLRIDLSG